MIVSFRPCIEDTGREDRYRNTDASTPICVRMAGTYEPTWSSLDAHPVPQWFDDAKLGIWIHWGIYSVPAWAPPPAEPPEHAYAEWYPYYMYRPGNRFYEYHRETYGADVDYADFIADWTAAAFDPNAWAELFADIGARYVVITGEHHDGFPLWDTAVTKYNASQMGPERDIVAELADAVRRRGLKFAPSFHGLLNYYQPDPDAPQGQPIGADGGDPPSPEYVAYMHDKLDELIEAYKPDLLWLDGDWIADAETFGTKATVARYYNAAEHWGKEVVVNDRLGRTRWKHEGDTHGDFYTPEYEEFDEIVEHKWEACRGIGHSFGYNQAEGQAEYLDPRELVHLFVDTVAKNGNLLINVGPTADGRIPEPQRLRLEALGGWLDQYGEAIFGTTYWITHDDPTSTVPVRYTWKDGTLYAIALEWPGDDLRLAVPEHVDIDPAAIEIRLLGQAGKLACRRRGRTLTIDTPGQPREVHVQYAHAFAIDDVANPATADDE